MDKSLVVGETSMKKLRFQTPAKLNDDMMNEVINHLPAISNFRFKCVSKQWFILNTEALRRKSQTLTMSGIFYGIGSFCITYTGIQKGPRNEDSSIDGTLSFLPKHPNIRIHKSCNGLLLCEGWNQNYLWHGRALYVCNPATRKWVEIPYDYPKRFAAKFLDFNPLDSIHFSVITISLRHGQYTFAVFSSKTEEWKVTHVTNTILDEYIIDGSTTSLIFRGLIFCLNWEGTNAMGFDMEGSSCRRIELPGKSHPKISFFHSCPSRGSLCQSGGFLHYYYKSGTEMVYVWKLVDYESGVWSLKSNFCVTGPLRGVVDLKLHPEIDDIVLLSTRHKMLAYNMQTTQITEFRIITTGYFPYSPCYLEGFGKHVETK